jgi:hypothetical protein
MLSVKVASTNNPAKKAPAAMLGMGDNVLL